MADDDVKIGLGTVDEGLESGLAAARDSCEEFGEAAVEAMGPIGVIIDLLVSGYNALKDALTSAVSEAMEAEEVFARLNAVNRAAGQAAGFASKELEDMATSMTEVTRFTDDAVQGAETMLLKFKSIKGDVFKDALTAAADLAEVMGTDVRGAASQLGMALENPEHGLMRLRRAGITFTESQREQIKAMTEAGNLAGAQQFILDQLKDTIGGVAQAMADTTTGSLTQFWNRIGEVNEAVGTFVLERLKPMLPVLDMMAAGVESILPTIGAFVDNIYEAGSAVVDFFRPAFEWLGTQGGRYVAMLRAEWNDLAELFAQGTDYFDPTIEALKAAGGYIIDFLNPAIDALFEGAMIAFTGMEVLLKRWGDVVQLVVADSLLQFEAIPANLIHTFTVVLPAHLEWFGRNWVSIWNNMQQALGAILGNMYGNLENFFKAVMGFLRGDGFDFKFTGLLEGFESTLEELPTVAERVIGRDEQFYKDTRDALKVKLGRAFADELADNRKKWEKGVEEHANGVSNALAGSDKALDQSADVFVRKEMERGDKMKKAGDKTKEKLAGSIEGLEDLHKRIQEAAGKAADKDKSGMGLDWDALGAGAKTAGFGTGGAIGAAAVGIGGILAAGLKEVDLPINDMIRKFDYMVKQIHDIDTDWLSPWHENEKTLPASRKVEGLLKDVADAAKSIAGPIVGALKSGVPGVFR